MAAGEAELRRRELESLHALSRAVADTLSRREVIERALTTLIGLGWFSCGHGWLSDGAGPPEVVAASCPDATVACLPRPTSTDVAATLARGVPGERHGWRLIPVADAAVFGLHGGHQVSASFLAAVTELVAAALKRTHLHQRLAEKEAQRSRLMQALLTAQEEERSRISRDLHDQIGQALTAILLGLDRNLERVDLPALAELRELAAVTLSDVRRIALDLRPSVLDELGLAAAVKRYARELQGRYALDVNVLVTLPKRLSQQEETVLYRVAQEALTNVVRHAHAGEVSIVATARGGSVQLVVEDDGVGFDPAALVPAEQIGLLGMRERVELLGGSLRIESAPGAGCSVHARIPLR
jgi:signal transduction histidine kinase